MSFKDSINDFGLAVTRLTKGNGQNQAKEPLFGGKSSKLRLCFPRVLILGLCVLYVFISSNMFV